MARSVAVVVGVGNPRHLTPLPGAFTGSEDVARWAEGAGYVVHRLTDERGDVCVADVLKLIKAAVDAGDVERLIVFFAGHGVAKGTYDDFWLMSDGVDNPNEAVNLPATVARARTCGIPHVIIVSDACRTMAGKDAMGVLGGSIFPNRGIRASVQLDLFYAARSGDPAFELATDSDREKAFGLFTREFVEALLGRRPQALDPIEGTPPRWAITAPRLRDHLDQAVPLAASRIGVNQWPDLIVGSSYPKVFGWLEHLEQEAAGQPGRRRAAQVLDGPEQSPALAGLADRFVAEQASDCSATRTGLTVHGAQVRRAAGRGVGEVCREGDRWHVHGTGEPSSIILDVGGDRYACLVMLPGFVGSVHVGEVGVDFVGYQGAAGSAFEDADPVRTREALAWLGAGLVGGIRDLAVDEADERARYLRGLKYVNPTFGTVAAYAYDRTGRLGQIRDLLARLRAAGQAVPYDVALLSRPPAEEAGAPVAGSYPLLTQGWALLRADALPVVREAATGLAATTWATATGAGGEALFQALERGEMA
ncbi:MAG: caspase family protein [Egibacteraceae bacterium]